MIVYRWENLRSSFLLLMVCIFCFKTQESFAQKLPENIKVLLDELQPLSSDRGDRELLYQYSVGDLSGLSDQDTRKTIEALAKRGVGLITFWRKGDKMEPAIEEGIRIARIHRELGLKVVIDASDLLYGFYDGTPESFHVDSKGNAYFDSSFAGHKMGCPFTVYKRAPVIRSRVAAFADAYKTAGVTIDMATADWEVDGPIEWNEAWASAKNCTRCLKNLPDTSNFKSFQAVLRSMRSKLMKEVYTDPVKEKFPGVLITNYAVYPNDGWRYWYDYFEYPQPELPHVKDQQALYRPWYQEFTETGFTMAMPVVYTWYPIYDWYPAYSPDYRWFYNMLKVGSNAAKHTPSGIPIASFVHWHTTAPPENPDKRVQQMSQGAYKELLWHLLLRGHDLLFSWCMKEELSQEMKLLQEVYDQSLAYNEWFRKGQPVIFDVPADESSVVSAIKFNNKVLVRRTDFKTNKRPITIRLDGVDLRIPYKPGECQVLSLE